MSGWPLRKLAARAALFGLIYATLAVLLFDYPLKGALLSAAIAGTFFAVALHFWNRRENGGKQTTAHQG